jgi:hypothetical protein
LPPAPLQLFLRLIWRSVCQGGVRCRRREWRVEVGLWGRGSARAGSAGRRRCQADIRGLGTS